jgi:hypothetical protein
MTTKWRTVNCMVCNAAYETYRAVGKPPHRKTCGDCCRQDMLRTNQLDYWAWQRATWCRKGRRWMAACQHAWVPDRNGKTRRCVFCGEQQTLWPDGEWRPV